MTLDEHQSQIDVERISPDEGFAQVQCTQLEIERGIRIARAVGRKTEILIRDRQCALRLSTVRIQRGQLLANLQRLLLIFEGTVYVAHNQRYSADVVVSRRQIIPVKKIGLLGNC